MRQVGILCAAALVALQENVEKLESDHKNARFLAGMFHTLLTFWSTNTIDTNTDTTLIHWHMSDTDTCYVRQWYRHRHNIDTLPHIRYRHISCLSDSDTCQKCNVGAI